MKMKAEKALTIFLSITIFLLLTIIMLLLVLFDVISIDLVFVGVGTAVVVLIGASYVLLREEK